MDVKKCVSKQDVILVCYNIGVQDNRNHFRFDEIVKRWHMKAE